MELYSKDVFENYFIKSLEYIHSLVNLEGKLAIDNAYSPCWVSYGLYNEVLDILDSGDVLVISEYLKRILSSFTLKRELSTSYLDIKYDILKLNLIRSELKRIPDKDISCGFLDSSIGMGELKKLNAALSIIKNSSPVLWNLVNTYIDEIVITGSSEGNYVQSAASFNLFGLVMIYGDKENDLDFYLEHIIHELSHIMLFTVNAREKFVLNTESERYKAPYRDDERPVDGIYHAYFVMSNIIFFLHQISEKEFLSKDVYFSVLKRIGTTYEKFSDTYKSMCKYAKFTETGKSIFDDCFDKVSSIY